MDSIVYCSQDQTNPSLCLFTSWVKVPFHWPLLLSFPSFLPLSFQAPLPCTHAGKDHEAPWRPISPVWTAAGGQRPLLWGSKQPQVPQGLSVVGGSLRGPECDGNPHEEVWGGAGTEGTGHPSVQGEMCVWRGFHLKHCACMFGQATSVFITYL